MTKTKKTPARWTRKKLEGMSAGELFDALNQCIGHEFEISAFAEVNAYRLVDIIKERGLQNQFIQHLINGSTAHVLEHVLPEPKAVAVAAILALSETKEKA